MSHPVVKAGADLPRYIEDMSADEKKAYIQLLTKRMMTAYGVKYKSSLAGVLDSGSSRVSNWVTQQTIPWLTLDKCHVDTGEPIASLIYGQRGLVDPAVLVQQIVTLFESALHQGVFYKLLHLLDDDAVKQLSIEFEKVLVALLLKEDDE